MEEERLRNISSPTCPSTVTVRRNPPRKAKATPSTTAAKPPPPVASLTNIREVPSFPIDDILSMELLQSEPKSLETESLKVFLRIKPLKSCTKATTKSRPKNVWPRAKENRNPENTKKTNKKIEETCITVSGPYSVTLTPPPALQEMKRNKTEIYEGFSHVFPADCSQSDVYDKLVQPLLEDFMKGKSGMLAALGPSGSGKTHTVFGSTRDPGIVPLALRQIFKQSNESSPVFSRSFYLSVFEIYSERGKGEKAYDLLGSGGSELSIQQSNIRGLQEVPIHTTGEAGSLIGQAVLKRATATTNSNSQSSRSQCIINIRAACNDVSNKTRMHTSDAMLTIVDLAGAEREKRTGNQGERLVESNFINNTSMVFGQCLRSLLEYQKNRKKGFQKHHQNSLLTRYLRDYLEGKKRMALILTVKAGEEDYLDTSYLLKQASPYMKIKFDNTEESCNKRQLQTFPRPEKTKRIKLNAPKTSRIEEVVGGEKNQISEEVHFKSKKTDGMDRSSPSLDRVAEDKKERDHIIMQNFAKVIWNVLKQYNEKLKVAEGEICSLKDNLRNEQLKYLGLETELINLKSSCLPSKQNSVEICLPKGEALEHTEEQFERNEDGNSCYLIETPSGANARGCNESPVVKDDELVQRHKSSNNEMEPRQPTNSEENVGIATMSTHVEAGILDLPMDQCCNRSAVAGNEDICSSESLQLRTTDSPSVSGVKGSMVVFSQSSDSDGKKDASTADLALEPIQEIKLSNMQTKSAISRRFPNSEKQTRNRRLLPASSKSVAEEINDLDINIKQIEKPQVQINKTHDQEQAKSTQVPDTEVTIHETEPASTKKQKNDQKPKRRLQPASSVLLTREINMLHIEDDVAEPKKNKGTKKTETQLRSQGSTSLLRLLTNNLGP